MHSIIKSTFYILFLIISLVAGIHMLAKSKGNKKIMIFGFMTLFLGIGEGFHLIPRILEIFTSDSGDFIEFIDTGRFIASLSIIVVYLILYWLYKEYYGISSSKKLDISLLALGFLSLVLSIVFKTSEDMIYIFIRNLPTLILALIILYYYKMEASKNSDMVFKYLWLSLLLALVFTLGFELLHIAYPFFIILMMPKTLMYIWLVLMGYLAFRKNLL